MTIEKLLHGVESFSTYVGKAFAWLIVALMLLVCVEVFKRYLLNMPTAWVFDVSNMLYGTLFMMSGAYALAHDAHVRGDFLYGSMKPRRQASIDLVLFIVDGRDRIASAGDVLLFPANIPHGATMLDEEVVLIDIFTPVREEFLPTTVQPGE